MEIEFNQQNDIKTITKELRKDQLSFVNRLQCIVHDHKFISSLNLLDYPLIPNERCGSWYLPPAQTPTSVYFKSTDGHTNEWKFSYRRLNLHLIPLIKEKNGVVIVDSTRKGKLFPDALSKTIPIWCAVLNCLCFGLDSDKDNWVRVPSVIPETEKNQIIAMIPEAVKEVQRLQLFEVDLDKPLVPYWIHPGARTAKMHANVYHVVCLNASDNKLESIRVRNEIIRYVQGSADDHEMWVPKDVCNGKLTPDVLWKCMSSITDSTGYIKSMKEEELIEALNHAAGNKSSSIDTKPIGSTGLHLGTITNDCAYDLSLDIDHLVVLSKHRVENVPKHIRVHHFPLEATKKGSKELRDVFPKLIPHLSARTLVVDDTGTDLCAGVAVILLIRHFDLRLQKIHTPAKGNKDLVKQFLSVINQQVSVNPSRNTLQSVNTFLSTVA